MFVKRLILCLIVLITLTFFAGCSQEKNSSREPAAPVQQTAAPQAKTVSLVPDADRKIIQKAAIVLDTRAFNETERKIGEVTADHGGLIEASNISDNQHSREGNFVIRVPREKLASFVENISTLSGVRIRSRSLSAKDITEEYIDVNARLDNLRLQEQHLRQLLGQAKNIEEVLKIETELNRVRTELDAATGRLKYLAGQTAMASVAITVKETNGTPVKDFGSKLIDAFQDGFQTAGELLLGAITVIVAISPLAALLYVLLLLRKKIKGSRPPKQS